MESEIHLQTPATADRLGFLKYFLIFFEIGQHASCILDGFRIRTNMFAELAYQIQAFLRFLWDFVIGDDWRIAAGVVVALGLTALVADTSVAAWWVLPAGVALLLAGSVWRAARTRRPRPTRCRTAWARPWAR